MLNNRRRYNDVGLCRDVDDSDLENDSVNLRRQMKAVYASTRDDLAKIKLLGFDTVIGFFNLDELDWLLDNGMSCIYSGLPIDHAAVIAYYMYDEPDFNKIPLANQEAKIQLYRTMTSLPLVVACVEQTVALCSKNFDWYLMDIYYMTELGRFTKLINYLNIAFSPAILRVLYKGKKIIPIMGLYDDLVEFKYTLEAEAFARKFRSYFRNEKDQAVFVWEGDGVSYWGINDRDAYLSIALGLNVSEAEKCGWVTDKFLMGMAHVIVWARSLITSKMLAWINSKLPANLKMKL